MEIEALLKTLFIALMIYCLYRFLLDNYKLIRARKFLEDPDNGKLLLAMLKYVNLLAEERGSTSRVPEIDSLEKFTELSSLDQDLVAYSVGIILEDKQTYINFFKERGDI